MTITIVCGLQFGDESKAKISDQLMSSHDICVRYSGANNTGATVCVDNKKYVFHQIPVGILQNKHCYIGSGCLIDPPTLKKEIEEYQSLGFDVKKLLHISPDAHIITENHIKRDQENEESDKRIGSTRRGVAYCAADKYSRSGIKCGDIPDFNNFLCDVSVELNNAVKEKKSILAEGSQGILLDIDHGFYPFCSSTNNVPAAFCVSCGISPKYVNKIVGVMKPYLTKVGLGPFPTKMEKNDSFRQKFIEIGKEYGTTTGRERDVGYLDLILLEYAARVSGITEIALSKCDVLEQICFDKSLPFKVCHSYSIKGPMESEILTDRVPTIKKSINKCIPIYDLYYSLDEIIKDIEGTTGVKVTYISRSPNRDNK